MAWWLWTLLGLFLFIAEIQASGFYLMFFGVGALLVGLLTGLGLIETDWVEWLLFSGFSIGTLALFRGAVVERLSPSGQPKIDSLVGEAGVAVDDIPTGGVGKVELRGSSWTAHNAGASPLRKAGRCRVERVDGLTLWVSAE